MEWGLPVRRSRAAWWGALAVLGTILAWFVLSFVGTFVLGLFFYYATRPLFRRLHAVVDRRGIAASLTLLLVVLPVIALVGYGSLVAVRELTAVLGPRIADAVLARLPGDPRSLTVVVRSPGLVLGPLDDVSRFRNLLLTSLGTLGSVANGLLHLTLSLALAFFLLRDGASLGRWVRGSVLADDEVAVAYLAAVDADLETVYLGNVLTVLAVGAAAVVVYHGFNGLAPPALALPGPTLLALLTGLATFVPLVVGKLVYVPATVYLLWTAVRADAGAALLSWVLGYLVVSFLVLDVVPQTLLRPYVSGRALHPGLVLFAYVLGAALFGWYGLFLGPLLAVLAVQAANVVLPEMLRGDPLTTASHLSISTDPAELEAPDDDGTSGPDRGEGESGSAPDDAHSGPNA